MSQRIASNVRELDNPIGFIWWMTIRPKPEVWRQDDEHLIDETRPSETPAAAEPPTRY